MEKEKEYVVVIQVKVRARNKKEAMENAVGRIAVSEPDMSYAVEV